MCIHSTPRAHTHTHTHTPVLAEYKKPWFDAFTKMGIDEGVAARFLKKFNDQNALYRELLEMWKDKPNKLQEFQQVCYPHLLHPLCCALGGNAWAGHGSRVLQCNAVRRLLNVLVLLAWSPSFALSSVHINAARMPVGAGCRGNAHANPSRRWLVPKFTIVWRGSTTERARMCMRVCVCVYVCVCVRERERERERDGAAAAKHNCLHLRTSRPLNP